MGKRIFIGSSGSDDALLKAENVASILREIGAEIQIWEEPEAFPAGENTIDTLIKTAKNFDGAAFILNTDDKLAEPKNDGNHFLPRDNVLLEVGLFMASHGKESVALVLAKDVHRPSDLEGVTLVPMNEGIQKRRSRLSAWYKRIKERNTWYNNADIQCNVIVKSRETIHEISPLAERLQITSGNYKYIKHIRIMNMAGNLIINPKRAANYDHIIDENQTPEDYIKKILIETSARMDLLLLEPNDNNLNDIESKIANETAGGPRGALYSALATIYDNLYGEGSDDPIWKTDGKKRVNFEVMKISMPYAIFGVEFVKGHEQFNHVKVDLYSAGLNDESDRRSFVIWQEEDPENYNFFINNFKHVFNTGNGLSKNVSRVDLKEWKEKWESMDRKEA
jgi:hypothetical protein